MVKNALDVIYIRLDITKEMTSEGKNRSVDGSCLAASWLGFRASTAVARLGLTSGRELKT